MRTNRFAFYGKHGTMLLFTAVIILPMLYTLFNSFMSTEEIIRYYGDMHTAFGQTAFHLFPDIFSLESYYDLLLARPEILFRFWTSLLLTAAIVCGQLVISVLAGYALAKFRFPLRSAFLLIIIILMMMPYQVTLVSNYIVLEKLNLIDTYWALILPGIFSPFGVFLMRQVFTVFPDSVIEAAELEGANSLTILTRIVLPGSKHGMISLVILSFIDNWNMVEQPLAFLQNTDRYPLSVFLASFSADNLGLSFASGVLAALPVMLLFRFFEKDLTDGIVFTNFK